MVAVAVDTVADILALVRGWIARIFLIAFQAFAVLPAAAHRIVFAPVGFFLADIAVFRGRRSDHLDSNLSCGELGSRRCAAPAVAGLAMLSVNRSRDSR